MIEIRDFRIEDARELLECHYTAVHITASKSYPKNILDQWSPEIDDTRIDKFLKELSISIRFVAILDNRVVGFSEYIPEKNLLGACYVHADYSGRGIGKALLEHLERHARAHDVKKLAMDSSVMAQNFYEKAGYQIIGLGEHKLSSGETMACVRMEKIL